MSAERLSTIEEPKTPIDIQLLSAYKKGNAFLPQTNFGVVSYVGNVLLTQTEHALFDLVETRPDSTHIAAAVETMNARHARYGVRPFGAADVERIYMNGMRLTAQMICAMIGVHTLPESARKKQAVEFLLHPDGPRREVVRQVFEHITSQFHTPQPRYLAKQWREAIGRHDPTSVRNTQLGQLVNCVSTSWQDTNPAFDAPFWCGQVLGSSSTLAVVHFGQIPDTAFVA